MIIFLNFITLKYKDFHPSSSIPTTNISYKTHLVSVVITQHTILNKSHTTMISDDQCIKVNSLVNIMWHMSNYYIKAVCVPLILKFHTTSKRVISKCID